MLNENVIKVLEGKGFKRWTKGDMDRLYLNAEEAGLVSVDKYRTGNICCCTVNGRTVANSSAGGILNAKFWIDIKDGSAHMKESKFGTPSLPNRWALDFLMEYTETALAEAMSVE